MRRNLLLFVALLGALCGSAFAAQKPNIILILTDDMGYGDIGPFGSKANRTPHLDRMAREGMRFTSFYAAPVCTPSRAQVLTGCYAKRVSLPDVVFPAAPIGLNPAEHTVAELLKARGYATLCIGKWHVGDQPELLPTRHGFDHYFGLPYSNDMDGPPPEGRPPLPLLRDDKVIEIVSPVGQDALTERYTEDAVTFIRENRNRPFFLYFPHTAVHVPLHPGEKFKGTSANGPYGDWVEEIDWSVGRVFESLHELKLAKQTLVIFSSDNGPWLEKGTNAGVAGPLRGGKGGTYEGGVRVPTVAWWPGHVPAGSVCDAVAGNIDFLPTFVKLAGGRVPTDRKIDGKDISPLLLGKSRKSPRTAQYYFSGNTLQAVRSGPWKLAITRQREGITTPTNATALFIPTLYHLDTDPGERNDVAALHPDVVKRLQKLVRLMDTDLGTNKPGPGVREPGRVANPAGLWLTGQAPASASEVKQQSAADRPNILWLVSEDNTTLLGCYGDPLARTPTLDKLAREVVLYERCFAQPVCAPSRFMLITGMYAVSHGPAQHMRAQGNIPSWLKGFRALLREAGYYTANNAKTDYNSPISVREAWDASSDSAHPSR